MEYYLMCKILIVTLISEQITSNLIRTKRSNQKFNVLINLYKMSPLRNSHVFRSFSNTVLLPNRGDGPGMNLDSNESVRRKEKNTIVELKRIEEKIHVTQSPRIIIGQPEYKLPNNQLEEFAKPMYSLNDLTKLKKTKDNQEIVMYHVNGKKQKVTKMLPVDKIPLYLDKNLIVIDTNETAETSYTTSMKTREIYRYEQTGEENDINGYFADSGVIVL